MLFVDPETRAVVANQADREGSLKRQGNVFVGTLPDRVLIAGTVTTWAGVRWIMLPWPLPREQPERLRFLAHETWHRVHDQLGLPGANPTNAHLDTRDGRTWLQLEWRALEAALQHAGGERRRATEDALTFRAYRRQLFPGAAAEERALEMNKGPAEYTGVRLSRDALSDRTSVATLTKEVVKGAVMVAPGHCASRGRRYGTNLYPML